MHQRITNDTTCIYDTVERKKSFNFLRKWVHLGVAGFTTLSLSLTLVMSTASPVDGFTWDIVAFNLHKIFGLNAFVMICIYFIMTARLKNRRFFELFPWASWSSLKHFCRQVLRIRNAEHLSLFAIPTQGVGILCAFIASGTGIYMIMGMIEDWLPMSQSVGLLRTHIVAGTFVWGYLLLHTGAVLLHIVLKQYSILNIFKLFEPKAEIEPTPTELPEPSQTISTKDSKLQF